MPTPSNRTNPHDLITGHDPARPLDLLLVNAPLRDYAARPRVNDFTLPVLGMGYIATYAAHAGFNAGVLDGEALGLPVADVAQAVNAAAPRWAGFNLLAPTYGIFATIAAALAPGIKVLLGGHQAKAMPAEILTDVRMARCEVLVNGEGWPAGFQHVAISGRGARLGSRESTPGTKPPRASLPLPLR